MVRFVYRCNAVVEAVKYCSSPGSRKSTCCCRSQLLPSVRGDSNDVVLRRFDGIYYLQRLVSVSVPPSSSLGLNFLEGPSQAINCTTAAASMITFLNPLQVRQEMRRESGRGSTRHRKGEEGHKLLYGTTIPSGGTWARLEALWFEFGWPFFAGYMQCTQRDCSSQVRIPVGSPVWCCHLQPRSNSTHSFGQSFPVTAMLFFARLVPT